MRILSIDQAAIEPGDTVFREQAELMVLLCLAMLAAGMWMVIDGFREGASFFGFLGIFMTAMAVGLLRLVYTAFLPNSWTVAVGPERLLVRFRPNVNTRFPASDPHVAEIPLSEVAAVRKTEVAVTQVGHKGIVHTTTERYVDLRLRDADLEELRERLRYERGYRARVLTIAHHPVSVSGSTIRIHWKGTVGWLRPTADAFVARIGERVAVEPEARMQVDLTRPETIPPAEREWYLRGLVLSGQTTLAAALARKVYGISADEAHRRVSAWEAS